MALNAIKNFLGLRTSVSEPEPGTALIASNFKRNRIRGWLELADGLAARSYVAGGTTYAASATFPNVIDSTDVPTGVDLTDRGIESFVPKKLYSFSLSDQGGRAITTLFASYTKRYSGHNGSVATSGVWITPYYESGAWVDGWLELTEFYVFKFASAANSGGENVVFTVENNPAIQSKAMAALSKGGWVIVRDGDFAQTQQTGFRVLSATGATITCIGQASDVSDWTTATKLYAFRNYAAIMLPNGASASTVPQFRSVLDEIRLSLGSGTTGDLSAFYRDKTFSNGYNLSIKGTYGEFGQLSVHDDTFKIASVSLTTNLNGGLEAGTYTIKGTLVTDDGQETALRDIMLGTVPVSLTETAYSINTSHSLSGAMGTFCVMGGYIYAIGNVDYLSSGFGYTIYKIDPATMSSVASVTIGGGLSFYTGIAAVGNYIYAMCGTQLLVPHSASMHQYDGNLTYLGGTGVWTSMGNVVPTGSFVAGNFYYLLDWPFVPANTVNIHEWNISSKAYVRGKNMPSSSTGQTMSGIGATASELWLCNTWDGGGYYKRLQLSDLSTYVDVNLTGADGAAKCGLIEGSYAYICAGTKLFKVHTGTYAQTVFYTGLSAPSAGIASDGTYLYITDAVGMKIVKLSDGTLLTSVASSSIFQAAGVHLISPYIYAAGYTAGANHVIKFELSNGLTLSGFTELQYDLLVSPGFLPKRARYIDIYLSKDSGPYYLFKEHDLLSTGVTFSGTSVYNSTVKHRYLRAASQTILAADQLAATTSATFELGRDVADTGVRAYSYAITANNRTYAAGVYIAGKLQGNRVYLNAVSGAGVSQYDVLPNDVTTILDGEFNDGDTILALGNVADRVLALKRASLILFTPVADGTHNRDIVATGIGIAATSSLCSFNEAIYWLDHSGVYQFTTSGLKMISSQVNTSIWDNYTDAQRAAAYAVIDPKNMHYRLYLTNTSTTCYVYDLVDNEWVTEQISGLLGVATDLGSAARRYMAFTTTGVFNPKESAASPVFAGTATYQTTRVELPLERGYDGILSALYLDYDCNGTAPTIKVRLYLDEQTAAVKQYTLPAGKYEVTLPAPLASRCKTFRVEIVVTATSGQMIKVKRAGVYFSQVPVGGDQQFSVSRSLYGLPPYTKTVSVGKVYSGPPPMTWVTVINYSPNVFNGNFETTSYWTDDGDSIHCYSGRYIDFPLFGVSSWQLVCDNPYATTYRASAKFTGQALVPGKYYQYTFYASGNLNGDTLPVEISCSKTGATCATVEVTYGAAQVYTGVFVADGTELHFRSSLVSKWNGKQVLIDNLKLEEGTPL
jgi:hypothetical protein